MKCTIGKVARTCFLATLLIHGLSSCAHTRTSGNGVVSPNDTISSKESAFQLPGTNGENLFSHHYQEVADSISEVNPDRYSHLTDDDFERVAQQLDVEVAAIKAVVEIEAGTAMRGFWAPGIPVINFDSSMFAKYKSKVSDKSGAKNEEVPEGLTGYGLKEYRQLINARKSNAQGAIMGTFWGMFQIGGFNYKICGCEDVNEFVRKMAYSEFEQLELFAIFIQNTGYVDYLRKKDWAGFARRYNGPSYAKRGYHTKMAKAYKKFSQN